MKEAIQKALGKIKSARDCHFKAIDTLLFEAEEILEATLATPQPAQQEPLFKRLIEGIPGLAEELKALDAAQPEQEPVAVVKALPLGHGQTEMHYAECQHLPVGTLLYTSPPAQRTWVGLTDEEFQLVYDHGRTPAGMMEMVEAKLKEKNT
jgi:hypothetical protein